MPETGIVQRKMPRGHIYTLRLLASTWRQVRSAVEAAVSELDWNVEISIDTADNLIVVAVPEDQDDMIVETDFRFLRIDYAQQLDHRCL